MSSSWPYAVGVIVIGGLVGVAIAGPSSGDQPFSTDITVSVSVSDSAEPSSTMVVSSTSTTASDRTSPSTTDARVADTTTSTIESDVAPATTVAGPTPRSEVRVVLANGDGRFDLVGSNAARLQALGYTFVDQTDVAARPPATILYVRAGFDEEAIVLAGDLQIPNAFITPLPSTPVTSNDNNGDIVVILGPDAVR